MKQETEWIERFCVFLLIPSYSGGSRGGTRGGRPPLLLDQTKAQTVEKKFLRSLSPLSPYAQGLDDPPPPHYLKVWMTPLPPHYLKVWMTPLPPHYLRVWMTPLPPSPYLKVWISHWVNQANWRVGFFVVILGGFCRLLLNREPKQRRRRQQRIRQKSIRFRSEERTTLHVLSHAFVHFSPETSEYDVKLPNYTFHGYKNRYKTKHFTYRNFPKRKRKRIIQYSSYKLALYFEDTFLPSAHACPENWYAPALQSIDAWCPDPRAQDFGSFTLWQIVISQKCDQYRYGFIFFLIKIFIPTRLDRIMY